MSLFDGTAVFLGSVVSCIALYLYYQRTSRHSGSSAKTHGSAGGASLRVDEYGRNALHLACMEGKSEEVRHLLGVDDEVSRALLSAVTPESKYSCLHLAVVANDLNCVVSLIRFADVYQDAVNQLLNHRDTRGYTALAIAANNGNAQITQYLLQHFWTDAAIRSVDQETPLRLAAGNGQTECVRILLEFAGATIDTPDRNGVSPLSAAVQFGSVEAVELLLAAGGDPMVPARDGRSPLHYAARSGSSECCEALLRGGGDASGHLLYLANRFGATALHEAASRSHHGAVGALLAADRMLRGGGGGGTPLHEVRDDDGFFPLMLISNSFLRESVSTEDILATLELLLAVTRDVDALDYGNGSALIKFCFSQHEVVASIVSRLLDEGANPLLEYDHGWCALHVALHNNTQQVYSMLLEAAKLRPEFSTYNEKKQRKCDNSSFLKRRGPHNRIPLEDRTAVLQGLPANLEAVASLIRKGKAQHIVVLVGAGISVNAGVRDFRGENGIYKKGNARAAFDLNEYRKDPVSVVRVLRDEFLPAVTGQLKPTATHYFLRLLHERGLLQRVYSQNIDMLERAAGLPSEALVSCHGALDSAYCMQCKSAADIKEYWHSVANLRVPQCSRCGEAGLLRPGITFFGEPLGESFVTNQVDDMAKCDLLIVMGTTLQVHPFAGLVSDVSLLCPRVLFNREAVGPFTICDESSYRDVAVLGDVDEAINDLARQLDWSDRLNALLELDTLHPI